MASNESNIDKLKQARDSYQSSVQTLLDRVQEIRDSNTELPWTEVQILREKIQQYSDSIDKLNEGVAANLEGKDYKNDLLQCVDFKDRIWEAQAYLGLLTSTPTPEQNDPLLGQNSPQGNDNQSELNTIASNTHNQNQVRLLRLDLPKFDGNQLSWQEYWDSFNSTIHSSDMPNITKFKYLNSTLKGDAAKLVDGFRLVDANYETVIEALFERYGNTELIIFAHFEQLLALSQTEGDTRQLQNTYDEFLSKLPKFIRVELHRRNGAQPWSINTLRELFREELKARQMGEWSLMDKDRVMNKDQRGQNGGRQVWSGNRQTGGKLIPTTGTFLQTGKQYNRTNTQSQRWTTYQGRGSISCVFCRGAHFSDQCNKVTDYEQRHLIASKGHHCFKCLSTKHLAKTCQKTVKCFYCSHPNHHSSLCRNRGTVQSGPVLQSQTFTSQVGATGNLMNPNAPAFAPRAEAPFSGQHGTGTVYSTQGFTHNTQTPQSQNTHAAAADGSLVYMQMAVVSFPKGRSSVKARIFLDMGSSCSYITMALAKKLGLKPFGSTTVSNARFTDPTRTVRSYHTVSLFIPNKDGSKTPINAFLTDLISPPLEKLPIDVRKYPVLQQLPLADHVSTGVEQVSIDIMIGQDHYYDFVGSEILRLTDGPLLIGSKLGYLTAGKMLGIRDSEPTSMIQAAGLLNFSTTGPRITNADIDRFWSLEEIGIKDDCHQKDDDLAVKRFNESVKLVDGRYEVGWPWRDDAPDLPDNYNLALSRLRSLNRKLQPQPEQLRVYDNIIKDQLKSGIIEEVTTEHDVHVNRTIIHYLPHHAVVKPSSVTTKVRIVHDASAKASKYSVSLNDCLLRGPVFLNNLCGLLLRFRLPSVAFACDIEKAFFQVGLESADRDVTRFFWLRDPHKGVSTANLVIYRFTKVLFGIVSSPFLLSATVKHHLIKDGSAVAQDIATNLYVDNLVSGRDTIDGAKDFFFTARRLFAEIGMNLREWFTNSNIFRSFISQEFLGKNSETRILGMTWDTASDELGFSDLEISTIDVQTKRHLVQAASRVFDPCGFLAPAMIQAKYSYKRRGSAS